MKKLLSLLLVGLACLVGCAPSDTGSAAPSDNTSQIEVPAQQVNAVENA